MNEKVFRQGLRLSLECLLLASLENLYMDVVEEHKGARQKFNDFVRKHKEK